MTNSESSFVVGERYYDLDLETIGDRDVPIIQTWVCCEPQRRCMSDGKCNADLFFKLHDSSSSSGTLGEGMYMSLATAQRVMLTWEALLEKLSRVDEWIANMTEEIEELTVCGPETQCSFCERLWSGDRTFVVGGHDAYICRDCLLSAFKLLSKPDTDEKWTGVCAFCGHDSSMVGEVVFGTLNVGICLGCVEVGKAILEQESRMEHEQ